MNPTIVGAIVFACTLGGVLIGNWLRTSLPEHHLDDESREAVKLGIGLIATMTALVLGLVTASAKNSFDAVDSAVKHLAVDVLTLDRLLARYGPETGEIRGALQHAIERRIDIMSPQGASPAQLDPIRSGAAAGAEGLADGIRGLTPRDDSQRALQSRAIDVAEALLQDRWQLFASGGTSVPLLFLVIILFWLTITFASFGLFAPRNATVLAVLFVCTLSVGSAYFSFWRWMRPSTACSRFRWIRCATRMRVSTSRHERYHVRPPLPPGHRCAAILRLQCVDRAGPVAGLVQT